MKKVLLTVAVLGTILLSGCEKEEALVPSEKTLLKADKGILCRGCADWDIANSEAASFRTATFDGETDTITAPKNDKSAKPANTGKNK